jgi:hypothetical protein
MLPTCVNSDEPVEVVYSSEQIVALNEHDRDWIRKTIGEALRVHSDSKMAQFKSWSPLGAVVAAAIFILVQWNAYTVFKTHTEDHLVDNDRQLLDLNLKLSAKTPINFKSIPKLLDKAKASRVSLSVGAIHDAGEDLIKASENGAESAEAWSSVIALADYRTKLNEKLAPSEALNLKSDPSGRYHVGYIVKIIPGSPNPVSSFLLSTNEHFVPADRAAIAETYDQHERREGVLLPEYVGFGGTITLDDSIWKNVVARDAVVAYGGGRMQLTNVYFINCTFRVSPSSNGRRFSDAVLAGTAVTLTIPN